MAAAVALDPYHQLGVDHDADDATIKQAYRRKAQEAHPDRNLEDPHATTRFQLIQEAYEILSDPDRRARYDREGTTERVSTAERAMGMLAGALVEVLKQADECGGLPDPRFSLIDSLNEALGQLQRAAHTRKRGAEQVITALEGQAKRVKYKGRGQNLIADVLEGQIAKARMQLAIHARDATDVAAAIELMKQYEGLPAEDLFTAMNELHRRFLTHAPLRRGDNATYTWT
jgi:curved DNA-binding protein CbpA